MVSTGSENKSSNVEASSGPSLEAEVAAEVEAEIEVEKSDGVVNDVNEDQLEKNKSIKSVFFDVALNAVVGLFFIGFLSFLANSFILGDRYVEKKSIKEEVVSLINNGAGLRAVRFHYDHRDVIKRDIVFALKSDVSLYYKYEVALSEVLEELRTEQFLNGNPDLQFIAKLNEIITQYTESNPFDKLETSQKDLFENIRVKLNGNYSTVADDVNKLSDELSNKNKLVNEYLSDSQTSLIVSIVSAFIAVILAGVQMWQNRTRVSVSRSGYTRGPAKRREIVETNPDGERTRTVHYEDGRIFEKVYSKDGSIISRRSSYKM